jgi:hypothetical protein
MQRKMSDFYSIAGIRRVKYHRWARIDLVVGEKNLVP